MAGEELSLVMAADTTVRGNGSMHVLAWHITSQAHRSNWNPSAGATEAAMTTAEKIVEDRIVVKLIEVLEALQVDRQVPKKQRLIRSTWRSEQKYGA